jgi:O-antigen ligase
LLNKNKIGIYFVNLGILLFLYRMSIPFFKYPFIIIYFGLIIYAIYHYKNLIKPSLSSEFIHNYYILLLLVVFFIYSFFITEKVYLSISKNLVDIIILLSVFLLLSLFIRKKTDLNLYLKNIVKLIILFAFVISIDEIGNIFYIFSDRNLSLKIDYNFAILPIIFGIIGLLYSLLQTDFKIQKTLANFLLIVFFISILLSGSRRGLAVLLVILLIIIGIQIGILFKKISFFKKLKTTLLFFSISLISLTILGSFLVFSTSSSFKNRTLMNIGSKNLPAAKERITFTVYRYASALNNLLKFSDIDKLIWTPSLDPKDPDSGWGSRKHKTIFPLTGNNVEIVPPESKGYLMNNTCNANAWGSNSYSFTKLYTTSVNDSDIIEGSVFCYVSKDFNGDWARIVLSSDNLFWTASDSYDLGNKGTWQKLNVSAISSRKEVSMYLYFCKLGVNDFTTLNGYIIFAYPKFKIISRKDSILTNILSVNDSSTLTKKAADGFRFREIEILNHPQYNQISMFNFLTCLSIKNPYNKKEDDPIRNWVSKFISEDTTYFEYTADISIDTTSKKKFASRTTRWQFAWQIFTKEYNWPKRIFGGGFNFLNWYGYYFDRDKTRSDYPHNPFLYIFLYSGIIGLLLYIYLMYKVFYYYLKYIEEYYLFFIFFLITYFFTFFSGGNPFDPPIMGFFIILPFLIHSVQKKSKSE